MQPFPLDPRDFVRHIESWKIEFAVAARRHRVGRGRIREVLAAPAFIERIDDEGDGRPERCLVLGPDRSGRMFEVIVVRLEDVLLVIHAMDMRPKHRRRMEEHR